MASTLAETSREASSGIFDFSSHADISVEGFQTYLQEQGYDAQQDLDQSQLQRLREEYINSLSDKSALKKTMNGIMQSLSTVLTFGTVLAGAISGLSGIAGLSIYGISKLAIELYQRRQEGVTIREIIKNIHYDSYQKYLESREYFNVLSQLFEEYIISNPDIFIKREINEELRIPSHEGPYGKPLIDIIAEERGIPYEVVGDFFEYVGFKDYREGITAKGGLALIGADFIKWSLSKLKESGYFSDYEYKFRSRVFEISKDIVENLITEKRFPRFYKGQRRFGPAYIAKGQPNFETVLKSKNYEAVVYRLTYLDLARNNDYYGITYDFDKRWVNHIYDALNPNSEGKTKIQMAF